MSLQFMLSGRERPASLSFVNCIGTTEKVLELRAASLKHLPLCLSHLFQAAWLCWRTEQTKVLFMFLLLYGQRHPGLVNRACVAC